ncbi:MAG: sugar phosphate isomerase/epimerase [Clostridiales bacterium]|nr:sugar phosphate isomerase/epimerase [Clostridiales bacterium]
MKLGLCTTDLLPNTVDLIFKNLQQLGCEVVQLSFASFLETNFIPDGKIEIPMDVSPTILDEIGEKSEKYSVKIKVINGTFNMSHPDKSVRLEGIKRMENLIKISHELGCKIVSLCSGTRNSENLWAGHSQNQSDAAWYDMSETIKFALEKAEKHSICLALESEAANIVDSPQKARRLLDQMESGNLKIIMDCANLFHEGFAKKENVRPTMRQAFEYVGEDIIVAHGKDIKESSKIEFCAAGEGIVDFPYFISLLKNFGYKGDMYLHGAESEREVEQSVLFMKKVMR